ncbi:ABC transporter substrate-binding protein, partial [Halomonas sp. SIMBA_159]
VDQVAGIVGALCSGAAIAAANSVAIPADVVMISPSATSPEITNLDDNDTFFRVAPSDAYQGQVLADYVLDNGFDRVALTYINNDYG